MHAAETEARPLGQAARIQDERLLLEQNAKDGICKPPLMTTTQGDSRWSCHGCIQTDGFITEPPLDRRRSASLRREICSRSWSPVIVVSQRGFTTKVK